MSRGRFRGRSPYSGPDGARKICTKESSPPPPFFSFFSFFFFKFLGPVVCFRPNDQTSSLQCHGGQELWHYLQLIVSIAITRLHLIGMYIYSLKYYKTWLVCYCYVIQAAKRKCLNMQILSLYNMFLSTLPQGSLLITLEGGRLSSLTPSFS